MRIVVVGGRGFIGERLVSTLRAQGHEALSASPSSGVDAVTGRGLGDALAGAQVVVDVTETRSFEKAAALEFFVTSSQNLLASGAEAGVRHHVALSVVGADRVRDSGYFRAKAAQEDLIRASSIPYTILRTTQFFEFVERILDSHSGQDVIKVPSVMIQPVAPDDVSDTLAGIGTGAPLNKTIELAGPESICLNELVGLILSAHQDPRPVIADSSARFFGAELNCRSLIPGPNPLIGANTVRDWLRHFIAAD